jgi:hypothetical protein
LVDCAPALPLPPVPAPVLQAGLPWWLLGLVVAFLALGILAFVLFVLGQAGEWMEARVLAAYGRRARGR